ncbi:MAG TPA: aldehyde dehydrogenase family protein, partial [Candidatus Dormibacteraeota bacterium]|nr:aldehyde dehydrogenase family protein [Candidatus Dormibacteraeota bacterium]
GKKIARIAADRVKRLHLELGGKAPVIIFDDADLDLAAETLRFASYWNSGQDCTAACRVIAGADQRSEIIQDEVFGPVVTVQRFSDEEQAIAWANDVRFGLAASLWTRDIGKALRVSKAIQFGTVWVNDHFTLVSEMPHGGFKESGYGKDQSMYAVEDYTIVKHVMIRS